MLRKRRYGRLRKAMGDVALLAGSPADAAEHYATAVDLARPSADFVWCAAALEGRAHAQVCLPRCTLYIPQSYTYAQHQLHADDHRWGT